MKDEARLIVDVLNHISHVPVDCDACPVNRSQEAPVINVECGDDCPGCMLRYAADMIEHLSVEQDAMAMEIDRLRRELEAAKRDLELIGGCPTCKFNRQYKAHECETCGDLDSMTNWQWRDPCEGNGGVSPEEKH